MKIRQTKSLNVSLVAAFIAIFSYCAGIGAASAATSTTKDKDSHVACEKELRGMIGMEAAVSKAIEKNDLALLRTQLETLESGVKKTHADMDRALLLGAWSTPELKQNGQLLSDRLETLRILNFIGLAFTSDYYANPTKKVSSSVKDSVKRFFVQLKTLTDEVAQANKRV